MDKLLLRLFDLRGGLPIFLIQGGTVSHWEDDLTVVPAKASVKVGESEKVLDFLKRFYWFNLLQRLHFFICHFDSLSGNGVFKEFDLVLHPLALVWCDAQPVVF